ncbi:MAG: DUF6364 family protein [Bacteroidota bacterium]
MDKKLTLSLNAQVIENAKIYARENEISLSKLIEGYLRSVTKQNTREVEITPLVQSLIGVVDIPEDFNMRKDYTNYLMEKYK